jgi:response regulator of citrate/malate metabolism
MKYKLYIIEGREFNAINLANETGLSKETARRRLKKSSTIDELYRPLHSYVYKTHIIEGEEFTTTKLMKILKCSDTTARTRLNRCNTIKQLTMPLVIHTTNRITENCIMIEEEEDESINKLLRGAW